MSTKPVPDHFNRSGRQPGSVNRSTKTFRDTVSKLLLDNSGKVHVWLDRVAENDPAKALDLLAKLAEYAAPKLSKVEMQSDVSVTHGYAFRIERPEKEVNPVLVSENSQSQIAPAIDQAEVIPLTRTAEKNPL